MTSGQNASDISFEEENRCKMAYYRLMRRNDYETLRYFSTFPYHRLTSPIRSRVYEFLEIFPKGSSSRDIITLGNLIAQLATWHADAHGAALERIANANEVIQKHKKEICPRFAAFADALRLGNEHVLSHADYGPYLLSLRSLTRQLSVVDQSWALTTAWSADVARWRKMPCYDLAKTLRRDLHHYTKELRSHKGLNGDDLCYHDILSEHGSLSKRLIAVETLGAETFEREDLINAFRHAGLSYPYNGTDAHHHRHITLEQAYTLGLLDVPWVRGYVWEEHSAALGDLPTLGMADSERIPVEEGTEPSRGVVAVEEKKIATIDSDQRGTGAVDACDDGDADGSHERGRERPPQKSRDIVDRICALMTTRLWTAETRFVATHNRPFVGCEMCHAQIVHMFGAKQPGSATVGDILLCKECYCEFYSDSKGVLNRMYQWHSVDEAIQEECPAAIAKLLPDVWSAKKKRKVSGRLEDARLRAKETEKDDEEEEEVSEFHETISDMIMCKSGNFSRTLSSGFHGNNQSPESQSSPRVQKGIDWANIAKVLPLEQTPEAKDKRKKLFADFCESSTRISTANGVLNEEEISKGLTQVLQLKGINIRPIIALAIKVTKSASQTADGNNSELASKPAYLYIKRSEFRLMLVFFRQLLEMWTMFEKVDVNADHRIDRREFAKAVPLIESWGGSIDDVEAEFRRVDKDQSGLINFEEWSIWALTKNLDIADDDDFDDEAVRSFRNIYTGKGPDQSSKLKYPSLFPQVDVDTSQCTPRSSISCDATVSVNTASAFVKISCLLFDGEGLLLTCCGHSEGDHTTADTALGGAIRFLYSTNAIEVQLGALPAHSYAAVFLVHVPEVSTNVVLWTLEVDGEQRLSKSMDGSHVGDFVVLILHRQTDGQSWRAKPLTSFVPTSLKSSVPAILKLIQVTPALVKSLTASHVSVHLSPTVSSTADPSSFLIPFNMTKLDIGLGWEITEVITAPLISPRARTPRRKKSTKEEVTAKPLTIESFALCLTQEAAVHDIISRSNIRGCEANVTMAGQREVNDKVVDMQVVKVDLSGLELVANEVTHIFFGLIVGGGTFHDNVRRMHGRVTNRMRELSEQELCRVESTQVTKENWQKNCLILSCLHRDPTYASSHKGWWRYSPVGKVIHGSDPMDLVPVCQSWICSHRASYGVTVSSVIFGGDTDAETQQTYFMKLQGNVGELEEKMSVAGLNTEPQDCKHGPYRVAGGIPLKFVLCRKGNTEDVEVAYLMGCIVKGAFVRNPERSLTLWSTGALCTLSLLPANHSPIEATLVLVIEEMVE